jgi:hypothetical protein
MTDTKIDIIAGISAGIVANIVSHPLDTIKVRMQLGTNNANKLIPTIKSVY